MADIIKHIYQFEDHVEELFIGCGHNVEDDIRLGAFMTIEELKDTEANYQLATEETIPLVRSFYAYFSTNTGQTMGFANDNNVYLDYWDFYDCKSDASTHTCSADALDDHRFSVVSEGPTEYWRCGNATAYNQDTNLTQSIEQFNNSFLIVLYLKKKKIL